MSTNRKLLIRNLNNAIKSNDINSIKFLLSNDKELLSYMTPFGSWLHIAASEGNIAIVELLLEAGIEIDEKAGIMGGNALNIAASEGHFEIVKLLYLRGSELDTSSSERNPLFSSIYAGSLDIVKYLIESGIDYSVVYNGQYMEKMDAKAFAEERGQTKICEYLKTKK